MQHFAKYFFLLVSTVAVIAIGIGLSLGPGGNLTGALSPAAQVPAGCVNSPWETIDLFNRSTNAVIASANITNVNASHQLAIRHWYKAQNEAKVRIEASGQDAGTITAGAAVVTGFTTITRPLQTTTYTITHPTRPECTAKFTVTVQPQGWQVTAPRLNVEVIQPTQLTAVTNAFPITIRLTNIGSVATKASNFLFGPTGSLDLLTQLSTSVCDKAYLRGYKNDFNNVSCNIPVINPGETKDIVIPFFARKCNYSANLDLKIANTWATDGVVTGSTSPSIVIPAC